jgi:hypothetical protein
VACGLVFYDDFKIELEASERFATLAEILLTTPLGISAQLHPKDLRKPQKEVSRNLVARSIRITRKQIAVTNSAGVAMLAVALAFSD